MRRWSVFLWPVVLAAMSDITTSAGPPSSSISCPGALSSRKSSSMNSTPGMGSMGRRSMPTTAPLRADLPGGDLRPAAGSGAEIDHALAGLQEIVLLVDLQQLEGRPRAVALALRPRHVGIVELALEPYLRRERALVGGLHPLLHVADARSGLAGGHRYASCRQTPSSRIMFIKIPSRSPRSAIRRRSEGNAIRIASRMAQPARTRSARSRPMHGLAARWS